MDDPQRRRSGGRAARQALRLASHAEQVPYLTRKLAPFEVLGEEGLSIIEHNADTILEEEQLWHDQGAATFYSVLQLAYGRYVAR